jgi:mono/diheme cytochrome c family protein
MEPRDGVHRSEDGLLRYPRSMNRRGLGLVVLVACAPPQPEPSDEASAYLDDVEHRREVLERDLLSVENDYARLRLERYAVEGAWEALPEWDPASAALTRERAEALQEGEALGLDPASATTLTPADRPRTDAEWIELGRRVWLEAPFTASDTLLAVARAGRLEQLGVAVWGDAYVGIRVFRDEDGTTRLGPTCALCHASVEADGPSAVRSNRALSLGGMRLLALQAAAGDETSSELDTSTVAQLELLLPGHSDPLDDGRFTPYAFPDLGGIADVPYLHHTASWVNASITTLAIRVETTYVTGTGQRARIPRELAWAVAMYLRSLPPPSPSAPADAATLAEGRAVFEAAGCSECHVPPLYTSDRRVGVEEIGTDAAAGRSPARATGYYRIPSLRGVGRAAPYLHHGGVRTLEELLDPERAEPGHRHGLALEDRDREALLRFLRAI